MAKKNGAVAEKPTGGELVLAQFTPASAQEASDLAAKTLGVNVMVREIAEEAETLAVEVGKLQVSNDTELVNADALRGKINAALKRLTAVKEQYSTPWHRFWKMVNGLWTTSEDKLDASKETTSELMTAYQNHKEKVAEEEATRIRKQNEALHAKQAVRAEKKGVAAPPPPVPVQASVPRTVGGTTFVKVWAHALVDEGKSVPREYLMVDHAKIKAAIANGMRNPDIAGVDIKQTTVPRGS